MSARWPGKRGARACLRGALAPVLLCATLLLGGGVAQGGSAAAPLLIAQGAKLTVAGEELGPGRFGRSVALCADGDTALIGAPRNDDELGAAWIFARSGSTWARLGSLAPVGENGNGRFGASVALSADGETALVGAPYDGSNVGAVWVFVRSGANWVQQAELTGGSEEIGKAWFGRSVALSADGDTAIVGGFVDHGELGAVWVFTRSGSTWSQQGPKLTGVEESGPGGFGWSVALSDDGNTALIGGRQDGGGVGAAWVFVRSGSSWSQQGSKLTGGGEESGPGYFGDGVALSGDGDTALIGGHEDGGGVGAAWVFARSGSTWSQQGTKLTGAEERDDADFGSSVALSDNGETALIGGYGDSSSAGAAWAFATPEETGSGGGAPPGAGNSGGNPPGGGELAGDGQSSTSTTTQSTTVGASSKQGVAAYKASGGGVVLVSRRISVRHGRAVVRLRCTASTGCRGRLTVLIRSDVRARAARGVTKLTIAAASFTLAHAKTTVLSLELTRAGRTHVRAARHGRLTAHLALRVLAPAPAHAQTYAVELLRSR